MRLHPRLTTWLWAARTLVIRTPAPIPAIGIRATHPPLARLFLTSRKSLGMIPARARWYRISRALDRPTAQRAYVMILPSGHSCKPQPQAEAAQVAAPLARLLSTAS